MDTPTPEEVLSKHCGYSPECKVTPQDEIEAGDAISAMEEYARPLIAENEELKKEIARLKGEIEDYQNRPSHPKHFD